MRFRHCFFQCVNIQNSVAQHAKDSGPQATGREITECILVVTPLAFWACDWLILPLETLLREYFRAAVKLSSKNCHGHHCLSVYLSNTYCRYKRLFGTLVAFSVMCSLWKIGLIFLNLLQTFCELMTKGDFKLW